MEKYPGKKNTAVFISGRGSNLKSLIKHSKKKNSLIKIILVISNNPEAEGLKYASKSKIKIYGMKNKSNFENNSIKLPDKIFINPAKQIKSILYFFSNLSDLFSKFNLFLIP